MFPPAPGTITAISVSIASIIVAVLLYTGGVMTVLIIQRLIKYYRKMELDSNAALADDPLRTDVTHTSASV